MTAVEKRVNRFEQKIRRRDQAEILTACFVTPLFLFFAWHSDDLWSQAGHGLVAASAVFIVLMLRRNRIRRLDPSPDQSLQAFTSEVIAEYDRQIKLLKSVKYWYVLPPYIGLILPSVGRLVKMDQSGSLVFEVLFIIFISTVFGYVWWLNDFKGIRVLRRERGEIELMSQG